MAIGGLNSWGHQSVRQHEQTRPTFVYQLPSGHERRDRPKPRDDHIAWLLFFVRTIQSARCPHQVVFRLRERLDDGPPSRDAVSVKVIVVP